MIMKKKSFSVNLIDGNIVSSLILFTIPIAISLLCQQLYNTIDTIIVGHYLGENSLAAVGAATPIYLLLLSFCFGMGNGLSIVTGRSFGSGDEELLKKTVAMSLYIAAATALVLTLIGQFGSVFFLKITHTPQTIFQESSGYILTITRFMIVMVAYNLCSSLLKAIGDSIMPLIFLIISSAINVVLDVLFITQFHMGVKGAAIATVVAQGISSFLCFIYIIKKVGILIPSKVHFHTDWGLIKEMSALGLSMGFMNSIVSFGTVILQYGINGMGELIIACHTTARSIFTFTTIPFTSMSNAMATFSAQNYGADQPHRIREAIRDCTIASVILAGMITLFMVLSGRFLIQMISGSHNEIILKNGMKYIVTMSPFFIALGLVVTIRVTLQGIGEKVLPLVSSGIEMAVKIGFAFLLIPVFHYDAVVFCEPIAWTLMAIELTIAFYRNPYMKEARRSK